MTHWVLAPIVLPAVLAPFILLAARYHIGIQRVFSVAGIMGLITVAAGLAWQASDGTITLYQLGDWAAPFGIVVVADRLSTLMVLLTSVLALVVLLFAIGSEWDVRGRHFHALYQFQLMGIMGAFLTGDLFNLFVFFEVLLIASYGLMIHAGGNIRLRAGDELMELANLLNEATLPIREGRPIGKEEPGADPESGAQEATQGATQEATQEATRRTAA